jgi:hypothetical protein
LALSARHCNATLIGIKLPGSVRKMAKNSDKLRGINVCTCGIGALDDERCKQ